MLLQRSEDRAAIEGTEDIKVKEGLRANRVIEVPWG